MQPPSGAPATFVPACERESFLLTFAQLVYERGYEAVELDDLADRLAVDIEDIERYWPSKDACALEAIDTSAERVFGAVARTFMNSGGDGPIAAHRALEVLVDVLAANPALAALAILAPEHLDRRDSTHRTGLLDVFSGFLGPGLAAIGSNPPHPEIVAAVLSGGIFELLKRHVEERRLHELPAALDAVSHVCVSVFFDDDEVQRVRDAVALA